MKKLFLFVAVSALTLSLSSCSKDSGGGGSLSLKIGGTKKSFKVIATEVGGSVWVHGYMGSIEAPTATIDFDIASGETGANKITGFEYYDGTDFFDTSALTSNVSKNDGNAVKGTFSGTLDPGGAVITEGTFSAGITSGE